MNTDRLKHLAGINEATAPIPTEKLDKFAQANATDGAKLLWGWAKDSQIDFKQFKKLLDLYALKV